MKKIIFFELNEVPWKVIEYYSKIFPSSTLAKILSSSQHQRYETYAEDQGILSPWITWPTMHRGVNNEKHYISDLGQQLSEIDQEFPPIWKILAQNKIKTGVFGSLHTYPPPNSYENYAFYVPDVFAAGSECFPKTVQAFQDFNLRMSRESARNVSTSIPWGNAFKLVSDFGALGFKPSTIIDVAGHLVGERLDRWKTVRRRTYQTIISYDIFMKQLQKNRPDFSTFFTNHVASSMHRYWAASFPEDYEKLDLSREWMERYNYEIKFTMGKADEMLRRLKNFVDQNPEYSLWIASSMGQEATLAKHTETELFITENEKFINYMGLTLEDVDIRPSMFPQVNLAIKEAHINDFRSKLEKLTVNGKSVRFREKSHGFFSLDFGYKNLDEKDIDIRLDGKEVSLEECGIHNVEIKDKSGSTAWLDGAGSMIYQDGEWVNEGIVKGLKDDCRGLAEDSEGNLWIGTFRRGAIKVVPSDDWENPKSFKYYDLDDGFTSVKNVLPYPFQGRLTFGCSDGLFKYNKEKDQFEPDCALGNQFCDQSRDVFSFIEDQQGNVWVAGLENAKASIGLATKQADGSYSWYETPFKKVAPMFMVAFYVEEDGTAWMGGSEGLYRYRKNDKNYELQANALIRKVLINHDSVIYAGGSEKLFKNDWTLPYRNNSLIFQYAVTDYESMDDKKFSYRLEGFEENWSKWNKDTKKEYTNLKEGNYTFQVKGLNIYGVESKVASFSFTISAPWHRTPWAYLAYLLGGFGLVWGIVKLNVRRLKKHQEYLEGVVKERTAEIMQQNEEIQVQAENLREINQVVSNKNLELEQQKEEISQQAENLQTMNDTIIQKNAKLEQQKEEILSQSESLKVANVEISQKRDQLEKSFNDVRILNDIGRKITSTLELKSVLNIIYENVNELMDASIFGIGLYNKDIETIDYRLAVENGQYYKPYTRDMRDKNQFPVWCIENAKPVFINDVNLESENYLQSTTENLLSKSSADAPLVLEDGSQAGIPLSLIYLPLLDKSQNVLGIITVQSFEKNAYTQHDLNLLESISVYIVIALENVSSYDEIKEAKENITDSINYAQTIQQAILPSKKEIHHLYPENFILFRPKDIVSGDFYWFTHITPKEAPHLTHAISLIAIVDCTGHGVPGAFMSMIGNTLLNEIVKHQEIFDPKEILETLDEGVREALHQNDDSSGDGMDVCLCVIEPVGAQTQITFSGAKRPLYYYKDNEQTLFEVKPNRRSIGGKRKMDKPFENHVIMLDNQDAIYLSSDGLVDQNNPQRKKIGSTRLKEILTQNASKSMEEIGHFLTKSLDEHQDGVAQRDDIAFIGIRF